MRRVAATALATGVLLGLGSAPAAAEPVSPTDFQPLCTPTDPGLTELSGLASAGGRLYAIGDSGSDDAIAELDTDCRVTRWIPVPVDTVDVEDLAVGGDGTVWLADTGDNEHARGSIALIGVDPENGSARMHRLTYPDGAHDSETLLLMPDGVPYVVTKNLFGPSAVYRPAGGVSVDRLGGAEATPLEKVRDLDLARGGTRTALTETVFTGGAVSPDGSRVVVRSYSHAHVFDAREFGSPPDPAASLSVDPRVTVELPRQPQGEAIAFTPAGDLLVASEMRGAAAPLPPILRLPDAADLLGGSSGGQQEAGSRPADADESVADGEQPTDAGGAPWVVLGGGLVAAAASFLLWRSRSRR
ncbi:hypothetical protein [Rhodococcus sp. HNM0569]|uniref:hypothetical protein n=1 Tax=Rhodococcus sp. HNM0569 TaxID=2716340 RepID=UPI00146B7324|nr:hypothetical protein [Rhodococcus sp. HNM0569]NLU81422.1 esterase-like activity of phytase family protein [Rhodococcus sp. HNM0569]